MCCKIRLLNLAFAIILILLAACTSSGPKAALDDMATALDKYDSSAFMAQIDLNAYATNRLKNITENDSALSSLNALSNLLGLGNLDNFIDSVVDLKGQLAQQFERGVASGEMMAQCAKTETPECPWVPQSLRNARIVELNANAAIAQVTTPAKLTSWLALRKIDNRWLVVGQAVMENRARSYALAADNAQKPAPAKKQGNSKKQLDI